MKSEYKSHLGPKSCLIRASQVLHRLPGSGMSPVTGSQVSQRMSHTVITFQELTINPGRQSFVRQHKTETHVKAAERILDGSVLWEIGLSWTEFVLSLLQILMKVIVFESWDLCVSVQESQALKAWHNLQTTQWKGKERRNEQWKQRMVFLF